MEIEAGRLRARMVGVAEAGPALVLRAQAFRAGRPDGDRFDAAARHLLVEGPDGPAACARVTVQDAASVLEGYAAGFYDLTGFARSFRRPLEVGRVCIAPGLLDPDVPRLLLAALARTVEREGVDVLHGCTSFPAEAAPLARLAAKTAPDAWSPRPRAPETRPLAGEAGAVPPLMRAWLSLGARVSDHAVVDRDLGTVHVFTALPVAAIPPGRARLLTGLPAPAD